MGLRDWVSEMDVGLLLVEPPELASMGLRDWVSEMEDRPPRPRQGQRASMGLRDWVSEMGSLVVAADATEIALQWGSETGSRRWYKDAIKGGRTERASMGLRDWVSEMAII